MSNTPQPFAELSPEAILQSVESTGLLTDGRLLALNSYENRVYQVGIEDQPPLIVKFYRPGRWSNEAIKEEHSFTAELAAADIPVVAPLSFSGQSLLHYGEHRFACFARRGGRAPAIDNAAVRGQIARCLGRLHAIGQQGSFQHREQLSVSDWGNASRDWLLASGWIPAHVEQAFSSVSAELLQSVSERFSAQRWHTLRLHGDCHAGNILWRDGSPLLVDLDDAVSGPAIQDLWMLLSGERDEMTAQLNEILREYQRFCDFNLGEVSLIEALRSLRLLRHATWLAKRWEDPAFPLAFPWFDSVRYWEDLVLNLREQQALMNEPALPVML